MRELRNLDLDKDLMTSIGEITVYTFIAILGCMLSIAIITKNKNNCSFAIWQNISYLQLFHWINLITIDDGSEFNSFFKGFFIIYKPFHVPDICTGETITANSYTSIKITSSSFINNFKELFAIYSFLTLVFLVLLLISHFTSLLSIKSFLKPLKYSSLIRLNLIFYLDLTVFSMITLYYYSSTSTCSIIDLILSVIFVTSAGIAIIAIPIYIQFKTQQDKESHHDTLFENILTLIQEFRPTFKAITYQYYTITLLYKFSLSFCLVLLSHIPVMQVTIIGIFQAGIAGYILLAKPYYHLRDTVSVFMAEVLCLLFVIGMAMRRMDFGSDGKFYVTVFCVGALLAIECCVIFRFGLAVGKRNLKGIIPDIQKTEVTLSVGYLNSNLKGEDHLEENKSNTEAIANKRDMNSDGGVNLNLEKFKIDDGIEIVFSQQGIDYKSSGLMDNFNKSTITQKSSRAITLIDLNKITVKGALTPVKKLTYEKTQAFN